MSAARSELEVAKCDLKLERHVARAALVTFLFAMLAFTFVRDALDPTAGPLFPTFP